MTLQSGTILTTISAEAIASQKKGQGYAPIICAQSVVVCAACGGNGVHDAVVAEAGLCFVGSIRYGGGGVAGFHGRTAAVLLVFCTPPEGEQSAVCGACGRSGLSILSVVDFGTGHGVGCLGVDPTGPVGGSVTYRHDAAGFARLSCRRNVTEVVRSG